MNTTATLYIPATGTDQVREGGRPLNEAPGVEVLRAEGERVVVKIGSGTFSFSSVLCNNVRKHQFSDKP